ncbi:hypothetical protein CHCC20335_4724 [Bacillus paralicheniformis]|nr:hypothetical protein CHCC20335_4724 [Bacillus paralicheniformis]
MAFLFLNPQKNILRKKRTSRRIAFQFAVLYDDLNILTRLILRSGRKGR